MQHNKIFLRVLLLVSIYPFLHIQLHELLFALLYQTHSCFLQKVLPRLSGSRNQLAEVLAALAEVCETGAAPEKPSNRTLRERRASYGEARYPRASAKIARMWQLLEANGFVSFMEAV